MHVWAWQVTYVAEENVRRAPTPAEQVQHPAVSSLLWGFDASAGTYQPLEALQDQYPRACAGCWMVDAVIPDRPVQES